MIRSSSYYVFHEDQADSSDILAYVLLHRHEPSWIVVNRTTFQIAQRFEKGDNADQIAGWLATKYHIPEERARRDVMYVLNELRRKRYLEYTPSAKADPNLGLNSVFFHLTNRCNLACPHCYAMEESPCADLPPSMIKRTMDELASLGGDAVVLSGGEPLLHPDIKTILQSIPKSLRFRILTNGTLIDGEWAKTLGSLGAFVQISIDGSCEAIHDRIRGEGSFNKAVRAIQYLQDAGISANINLATTVMNSNYADLENIVLLARRLGVPRVRFLPLRRVGSAHKHWESTGSKLTVKDQEQFYEKIAELSYGHKECVDISCGLSGFLLEVPDNGAGDDLWCPIGRDITVGASGDVFPCVLMMRQEFKLGNIFLDTLRSMVESDRMRSVLKSVFERKSKIEKCAQCHWRNLCQAGCMGQALDHTGNVLGTDDLCNYRKKAYKLAFQKIPHGATGNL